MNIKTKFTIAFLIAAAFSIATITTNTLVPAFAASSTSSTANAFGQGASQLGQSGQMGSHASDPIPTNPGPDTPRLGIGNVGNAICGEKLTPGEVASSGILGPPINPDACP